MRQFHPLMLPLQQVFFGYEKLNERAGKFVKSMVTVYYQIAFWWHALLWFSKGFNGRRRPGGGFQSKDKSKQTKTSKSNQDHLHKIIDNKSEIQCLYCKSCIPYKQRYWERQVYWMVWIRFCLGSVWQLAVCWFLQNRRVPMERLVHCQHKWID